MSWWYFEYDFYSYLGDIIYKLKRDKIWYDSVLTDNTYRKSREPRGKSPIWVWKVLKEFQEILHDIDWDISWDSTIKKWYFDKKKKKIIKLLDK